MPILLFFIAGTISAEIGYQEPWGKDAELIFKLSSVPALPTKKGLWIKMAEQAILFHQNVLSPVDGPRSHFSPSSSNYMLFAMWHYGFIKGFVMGCDRLLRENKEDWVYRTITIDGKTLKWDPID